MERCSQLRGYAIWLKTVTKLCQHFPEQTRAGSKSTLPYCLRSISSELNPRENNKTRTFQRIALITIMSAPKDLRRARLTARIKCARSEADLALKTDRIVYREASSDLAIWNSEIESIWIPVDLRCASAASWPRALDANYRELWCASAELDWFVSSGFPELFPEDSRRDFVSYFSWKLGRLGGLLSVLDWLLK